MLVDLARNDVGRVVRLRHRAGRRAHDPRALQPRHAPDVAGVGPAARRARADRRAAGHPAGRHGVGRAQGAGHADHRRARADQARSVRRGGRLRRLLRQPRHRHRHPDHARAPRRPGDACRPAPGIVADCDPAMEDLECRNKAAALLAAVPGARRITAARAPGADSGPPRSGQTAERGRPRPGLPAAAGQGRRRAGRARRGPGDRSRRRLLPAGPVQPGHRRPGRRGVGLVAGAAAPGQGRRPGPGDPDRPRRPWCSTPTEAGARRWSPGSTASSCGSRPTSSALRLGAAWPCGAPAPRWPAARWRPVPTSWSWTPAGPAWRVSTCSAPSPPIPPGVPEVGLAAYQVARIEAGVPAMGAELDGAHHPGRDGHRRAHRQLHQGLLHRPGAGRPDRLTGRPRPPAPPGRAAARRAGARRGRARASGPPGSAP